MDREVLLQGAVEELKKCSIYTLETFYRTIKEFNKENERRQNENGNNSHG